MQKMMRSAPLLILTVCSVVATTDGHARCSQDKTRASLLEVRLSLPKKIFLVGERISVRVEVRNCGEKDLFVPREILNVGDHIYSLRLSVRDSRGNLSPASVLIPEPRSAQSNEGFSSALSKWWVALPRGYFYGTYLEFDSHQFDFLRRPGRYVLQGVYSSMGMYAPLHYNRLVLNPEEIDSLPFESWTGEVGTNAISFEIAGAPQAHGPKKKAKD